MPATRPSEASQVKALTVTFLARFFEHEHTTGRGDLRESFFWVIAALATPGVFFPLYQQFHWTAVANYGGGVGRLHVYALLDKTFYLTLSAFAIGLLSATAWNAMLVDRRDGLILGGLPLRSRTIVASKLLALATYIVVVSSGMHAGASVLYSVFLESEVGWSAIVRAIAAHFVSASALSLSVFGFVVGVQSLCLALVGPRRFARPSAALQLMFVAVFMALLIVVPPVATGAVATLPFADAHPPAWLLRMPPIWFLGLYETIRGTPFPVMHELARTALLALGAIGVLVAVTYPIACRRTLSAAVTGGDAPAGWSRMMAGTLERWLTGRPEERAAVQFFLATLGRVAQHRLVLTFVVGLGMALVVPTTLFWATRTSAGLPSQPIVSILAVPLVIVYFTLSGLRVAIALPSELGASWIFDSTPSSLFAGRVAARRVLLMSAAPALAIGGAAWWYLWGFERACWHLVTSGLATAIAAELYLWGYVGIPCAQPLALGHANIQARWPLHVLGLLAFCLGLPALAIIAGSHVFRAAELITALVAVLVLIRRASARDAWISAVTGNPQGLLLLDLTVVTPARKPRLGV